MAYQYDKREMTHGNKFGGFAEIKVTSEGKLDRSVPITPFTGLRSSSFETTTEQTKFYADNQVHMTVNGAPVTEGSITCYQFKEKFAIDHIGFKKMENGGLTDTGIMKAFIWQYIETVTDEFGGETDKLNIYYNVKAARPQDVSNTDEESVEGKEFEIPCTASPNSLVVDEDGDPVTHFSITKSESNAALFEFAKEHILLPTDTEVPSIQG